jgi:hypothetical protein
MRTLRLAIGRLEARLYDVSGMTDKQLERFIKCGDFDSRQVCDQQLERIAGGEHPERALSADQLAECRRETR